MAFPQASDYRPPIIPDGEVYDNPDNGKSYYWTQILLPEGSTPDTATSIGGYWTVVCEGSKDEYVKKAGDTMTGDLVMNGADIEIDNGNLEFETKGDTDYVETVNNRFAKIVSRAPKDFTDNGQANYKSGFGIKVDLTEGSTSKNRFIVGNQHGDIVKVSSGKAAQVEFGTTGFNPDPDRNGVSEGITILGIPTPDFVKSPDDIAVNKGYVDARDEILQQEIIELEEEIDAIAPSTQRGEWHFDKNKSFPDPGDYYLLKGASGANPEATEFYNEADGVVFHNVDGNGVINTWSNVAVGELIQIFDKPDPDFVLGTITNVDTTKVVDAVWIEFDRISAEGGPNNNPDIKLSRINIFEAPSGGEVSGFVLKTGDTMSGSLKFSNKLNSVDYNVNSAKAKISFLNETSGGATKTTHIYQPGDINALVSSGEFKSKGNFYSAGYFYGWNPSNGDLYNPRIYISSSNYGALVYGSTEQFKWGNGGLFALKKLEINVPQPSSNSNSFVIRGRRKNTSTGALENNILLKDFRRANSSTSSDYIHYYGDSGGDYEIANKKYVDSKLPTYKITKSNGNYYVQ